MKYSKNYCEEKEISTSKLNEAQKTLYYVAEKMKMNKSISEEGYKHFQTAIKALEQERKTGHWYIDERPESDREIICSSCEQPIFKYHKLDFDYRPRFCPNCGCRMMEDEG